MPPDYNCVPGQGQQSKSRGQKPSQKTPEKSVPRNEVNRIPDVSQYTEKWYWKSAESEVELYKQNVGKLSCKVSKYFRLFKP